MEFQRIALGYNNVYALERDGRRVLIDTGPDYRGAAEALLSALRGWKPEVVVATHGHLDHAGLGAWWQRRGVEVVLGAADAGMARHPHYVNDDEMAVMRAFIDSSGAPEDVRAEALAGLELRRAWAMRVATEKEYPPAGPRPQWPTGLHYEPFAPSRSIDRDEELAPGLRVLVCPGHTPGNLVLFDAVEGWLFSGDQLLPDITPTPAVQADATRRARFHSLPAFAASLERLRGLEAVRCYPGHGAPFEDVAAVVEYNVRAIEERTARVQDALREGPATLYGICERMYPRALRRRFWQIAATVRGHLDILEARGQAVEADGTFAAR